MLEIKNILLVEDEPIVLKMVATMLERMGHHVVTASLPSEALRLTRTTSIKVDLVVTDIIMPEMNGWELAKQLQAERPGVKCLYMSGYTAGTLPNVDMPGHGVHFITKPFTKDQLALTLLEMFE